MLMQAWKWGPALAAGCCSILKPAEWTTLTALQVGAYATEVGFPDGVVQILPGMGDVGQAICRHPGVAKIAFTGSTATGYEIMRESHPHNLKRITLELGGKSPNIICHDADVDLAVEQSHVALFLNQGQCCCAGSRLFVHEDIYEEFCEKAVARASGMVVGDMFAEDVVQGPQVSQSQFDKVMSYIQSG
jgi:aldehyde dehydrogenase (NAD+)